MVCTNHGTEFMRTPVIEAMKYILCGDYHYLRRLEQNAHLLNDIATEFSVQCFCFSTNAINIRWRLCNNIAWQQNRIHVLIYQALLRMKCKLSVRMVPSVGLTAPFAYPTGGGFAVSTKHA